MGQKILLADDSITIQKVIELTFSDEDFELHTVGNGQKAIDEIRSIQPDIVLCDIIMPEKNGYEVCEFIKSQDDLRHVPVLLLTGAFEPFDQERAKAAGCEGFLAKPFEPQTLISKVKELLSTASPTPAAAEPPVGAVPEMFVAEAPPAPAPVEPSMQAPAEPLMPAPAPPQGFTEPESDQTVMVSPEVAAISPQEPEQPQGLGDTFAVEAGERELAMDSSDHSMLLGDAEPPASPPAAPVEPAQPAPVAGDDIWGDVAAPAETPVSEPPAAEPEAATVFMEEAQAPAAPAPSGAAELGQVLDQEFAGHEDPDATWQMPAPTKAGGPPTPAADFGDFEDFSAASAATSEPASTPDSEEPPARPIPMEASPMDPESDPFTPAPPVLDPTSEPPEPVEPEPIPSVNTEATIDPVMATSEAFAPLSPDAMDPAPPEQSPEVAELISTSDATVGPDSPFYPAEPTVDPPAAEPTPFPDPNEFVAPPVNEPEADPVQPLEPVVEIPPVASQPIDDPFVDPNEMSAPLAAAPEASEPAPEPAASSSDEDALVERIAQRVVDKLSSEVLQEIAWEVVPDLAEAMIKKEIDALKAKMPNSG